jgi:hypothetical protein
MVSNAYFDSIRTAWRIIFEMKFLKILNVKHCTTMNPVIINRWTNRIQAVVLGQLYGLEKFWAFLKYSRRKSKINPKLEEILKNYKRLEDFRVEGASFPQQFFPTKSGIIVR